MKSALGSVWICFGNAAAILLCVFAFNYVSTLGMLICSCTERNPDQATQAKVGAEAAEWTYYARALQTPPQMFWRLFHIRGVITQEDAEFLIRHPWVSSDDASGDPPVPNFILRPKTVAARALFLQGAFWVGVQLAFLWGWMLAKSIRTKLKGSGLRRGKQDQVQQ